MTTLALPVEIREELAALRETGLYPDEESILVDALGTFFASRPDLRRAAGLRLYEKGHFSLGRTAEWCGLSIEELKNELHKLGISRLTEDDSAVIDERVRKALEGSGKQTR